MERLHVVTFNIRTGRARDGANNWEHRRALVSELMRDLAPGVLCVQEAQDFQVSELTAALPEYGVVGQGRRGGSRDEHVPVYYSRDRLTLRRAGDFWLSERPDESGSVGWDAALPRICSWAELDDASGVAFAVFNVHLDHVGVEARVNGARLVASRASACGLPSMIVGDLNAAEDSAAMGALRSAGFADTYRAVHPDRAAGTFHGFTGSALGGKIDYVLADSSWTVHHASVVTWSRDGRWPSDHFPVTADVVTRRP